MAVQPFIGHPLSKELAMAGSQAIEEKLTSRGEIVTIRTKNTFKAEANELLLEALKP